MTKALVTDLSGPVLTDAERTFLEGHDPWGIILFARNVVEPDQVARLCAAFREAVGRPDAPVFVDQEGGRVQRLREPNWRRYPAAQAICDLHARDRERGLLAAYALGRLHARDLRAVGITVNCLPVVDVATATMHDVIGDRALGHDPHTVAALGRAICDGLCAGGVAPVLKHIPGHGRARADSHAELPVVNASEAELRRTDFAPFVALRDQPIAMTAHVVYSAIDPHNAATLSATVMRLVREELGFDGLVVSDDICMNALSGSIESRAHRTVEAGCDIVLHCNAPLEQRITVAQHTPALDGEARRRANAALATVTEPDLFDAERFEALMDELAPASSRALRDPTRYVVS